MEAERAVVDSAAHTEVVQNLCEKLRTYYVFPDVAEQICENLQKHLQDGDYADITEGEGFALTLSAHMQEANHDRHLGVRYYPEPLPEQANALHENEEWVAEWRRQARNDNYGLHKAERLPGNVGYLDIRSFSSTAYGGDTAVAAMAFLSNTNALIFDLRQCRGGNPEMVALITSYLFGEERVHLNSLYWREGDITEQYWTQPYVPGGRYEDRPVYVLTSDFTFSGGEEFAYNLQTHKRATVVGETTHGGAHPGATYRLHPHFDTFIPNGRAINPITGDNWEGCGITPDVPAPKEEALKVAYRMALETILADLGEASSRPEKLLKEEALAALKDL